MNISLDYDNTFTADPAIWAAVALQLREAGHTVYGVTMRTPAECTLTDTFSKYVQCVDELVPTSRAGKQQYMQQLGITIDVWIDDRPDFILHSAR